MIFTILGYIASAFCLYVLGCIRGEQMERERAKRMVDTNVPFYTMSSSHEVYYLTTHEPKEESHDDYK
jgi:hypothetical protein